jgi:hypothetical protein
MYRGWLGSQQLRCDIQETEAGPACATYGNPTSTCQPKIANNGGCFYEWECATNTCNDNCTCVPNGQTWTLVGGGLCPAFFGADSGLN